MPNALTRKRKQPGEMREVLAQNINRLMESRYRESTNRPMALAKDARVSLSSVQRTLSRETGATIDTVEAFAKVFRLPPFQLLVPWGLLGEMATAPAATPLRQPLFRGNFRHNKQSGGRAERRRKVVG